VPDLLTADGFEALRRLAAATVVGALIGLDREVLGKPLGFRTLSIVSIASCALTVSAAHYDQALGGSGSHHETVGRAIQGLMAGIGFLGGGVILHTRGHHVHGLTTAALVWLTAALGVVCGLAQWPIVIIALLLAMTVLLAGKPFERRLLRRPRGADDGKS
jgi:putative Mg2+ transporter-C (MgtC) family protein